MVAWSIRASASPGGGVRSFRAQAAVPLRGEEAHAPGAGGEQGAVHVGRAGAGGREHAEHGALAAGGAGVGIEVEHEVGVAAADGDAVGARQAAHGGVPGEGLVLFAGVDADHARAAPLEQVGHGHARETGRPQDLDLHRHDAPRFPS